MARFTTRNQLDLEELFQKANELRTRRPTFEDLELAYEELLARDKIQQSNVLEALFENRENQLVSRGIVAGDIPDLSKLNEVRMSFLGTPVHMPVTINGVVLPNEPLVTITGDKKIIRTAITGVNNTATVNRRGTYKELINTNDYIIKIVGRMVNEDEPSQYPEDNVKQFKQFYELRKTVSIESKLTELFDIRQMAIHKINLPGEAGMLNNQFYEITGYSDETLEKDKASLAIEPDSEPEADS